MEVCGWGRYPRVDANIIEPLDPESLALRLRKIKHGAAMIPRGAGRSYGDSGLADTLVSSRFLDHFMEFDALAGTLQCAGGTLLDDILKLVIPKGWFPPVVPGTRFVSVGGAVAADIHGKNHHRIGSFCDHLLQLRLMLASGEIVTCSNDSNAELFHATCGGMGLTGIVLDATLKLQKVSSVFVNRTSYVGENLEQSLELLQKYEDTEYAVAWLDCLARGAQLGRSILFTGEHSSDTGTLNYRARRGPSIPVNMPRILLNPYSMRLFNSAYFHMKNADGSQHRVHYDSYFFPLDNIRHWNRLYGSRGFLQYQFVLPHETAATGVRQILQKVSDSGKGSFLTVLKSLGARNRNLLSFPRPGITLTLDFKWQASLFPLLETLDAIVIDHGGCLYLAKDARMSEATFKQTYPEWEAFMTIKQRVDPHEVFASRQSTRLGMTTGATP